MNFLRLSNIAAFALSAFFCVSYAHSNQDIALNDHGHWKAPWYVGSCSLKVDVNANGEHIYTANDEGLMPFPGFWPSEEGEIYLETPGRDTAEARGLDFVPRGELTIRFKKIKGEVQPVGYTLMQRRVWNNKWTEVPFSCNGLEKIN